MLSRTQYTLTQRDRTYLVMPLFHVHGLLCGLLATLLSGGSAVIPPRFSAGKFWEELSALRCNWYTAGEYSLEPCDIFASH